MMLHVLMLRSGPGHVGFPRPRVQETPGGKMRHTEQSSVDTGRCPSPHSVGNRAARLAWSVVWAVLFRPSPRFCHWWRRLLLRLFGARLGRRVHVYPSCRIWAPWNLEVGDYGCLADNVDCYCVAAVSVGAHSTVSQYSYLCSATHDPADPTFRLVAAPITIADQAWVCADVFVGPGVSIGQGAVVGARASVFDDVPPWTIVGGTPARFIKHRTIRKADAGHPILPEGARDV